MGCSSANEPVAKKTAYISREKEQKEKIDSESYQSLQKSSICTKSFLGHGLNQYGLPKLKLVLDLDETLVHSRFEDYMDTVQVNTRPGLIPFLEKVSKLYDLYIFTAATPDYASYVLNVLDPNRTIFKGRFYRRHCTVRSNESVDVAQDFDDLSRIILVDNSPVCFLMQPENGVPISSFYDDGNDQALFKLERLLRMLDSQEDVRPHLQNLFNLTTEHIYRAIGQ
eukprot:GSMAST32.ASY1.ANO1.2744.1 assembled CDS